MVNSNPNHSVNSISVGQVLTWLEAVKDPEIPVLSLVDLGVITDIKIGDNSIHVEMTPTFVGCPAIDMMKSDIENVLRKQGIEKVSVSISFKQRWSSDMISEKGRAALKKFGLAPPPQTSLITDLEMIEHATCPRCQGNNTEVRSPFGSTLCRSIHYCFNCHESFEQFKPL